jgi:uncharacterized protein
MNKTHLKLKQNIGVTVGAIALFSALPSYALTVQEVPNPRQINNGWVTDSANILSIETENQLNQMISQLERENGTEIAVVTVPETSPSLSPKEFATALFNYWGIGKADRDNGVLLLISVGDRRAEIETGYGMESILPDAKVGNIIDTQIIPYFKQKRFDEGTLTGTKALIIAVETSKNSSQKQTEISSDRNSSTKNNNNFTGWIVLFLSPLLSIPFILHKRKVFVRPDEVRKRIRGYGDRPVFCMTCKQKMERVDETLVNNMLSKPEKIARQIGSIHFESWKCSQCDRYPVLIGYTPFFSRFRTCHKCHELTVTHTEKTLQYPTRYREGKRLMTDECHCCGYYQERQKTIARLPSPSSSSSSSSSSSYGGSSCSSSSSSGSDFGGGSSGGGGAGGSW